MFLGKLSFLTTKDDRIRVINERINLTEKHLNDLRTNFSECTRKMAKQRDAYDELAKCVRQYAQEEEMNESLGSGMKSFTNAITILADYMHLNVQRMETKIVGSLTQFDNLCRNTRDNLRTAVIARDKEVLKQRQMLELKTKFLASNSNSDAELLKARLEVNRTNREIDEVINSFEIRKLNDVKLVLNDFILISMKYHTKVLEALSASYYDVSNIDEKQDFAEFQKLMKTKEEPKIRKFIFKKGMRSQSMEELERSDELLSPYGRRAKLSRSTKNLNENKGATDKEDDDEDEDDDDEEEEEESGDNSNAEEEDSGTVSEEEEELEEAAAKAPKDANKDTKIKPKDPFKAVAGTHVLKQQNALYKSSKPFVARGSGIGIPMRTKRASIALRFEEQCVQQERAVVDAGDVFDSGGGGDSVGRSGSRLVTVVESKQRNKSGVAHVTEVIDCTRNKNKNSAATNYQSEE